MDQHLLRRPGRKCDALSRVAIERYCVTSVVVILCILVSGASLAAPIASNTALPLSAGEIIVREQFVMIRSSDHISGTQRKVDRFESRTVLGYGATSKLAFFGVLPLIDISREIGNVKASKFGLGDAVLFARYELFRSDQPGRTLRVAPYAGIRLPTGRDGKTGDGSIDVFGGIVATFASTQWVLDTQVGMTLTVKQMDSSSEIPRVLKRPFSIA